MQTFQISLFRNKLDNVPRLVKRSWSQLCENFRTPVIRLEKDGPLFSPATFDPPKRAKVNAKQLSLLVLDLDHNAKFGTIKSELSELGCAFIISSTHSHRRQTESNPNSEPRYRVVIPLARPIPAGVFPLLWNFVKHETKLSVDESAKDASRIFYTPAIASSESSYEYDIQLGQFLDWEKLELLSSDSVGGHYGVASPTDRRSEEDVATKVISNGSRNQELFKIGKRLAESQLSVEAIQAALLIENKRLCADPLPTSEVETIAANAIKYPITLGDCSEEDTGRPIPLPENHAITPALSESLLPTAWRPWLSDISDRLQCPLDYAAVSALVSAASLIGNRIRIRPKQNDTWIVVPNLWGAIVGPPGVMKTPAVNEGLIFFRLIADQERRNFEERLKDAEFDKEYSEAKKAEIIKEMKKATPDNRSDLKMRYEALVADEPVEKRLWTADSTVEKLGVLLDENPEGILILRDELTGWLRSLDRSGHEQDRAFYLEAWNGAGSFTFDRIGRGKTHIKNLTLSLLGTIQPSMLESYIKGSVEGWGNDGLIQRFQVLVYPEVHKIFKYKDQPPKGRESAKNSFELLYSITPREADARFLTPDAGGYAFLQFDEEAQEFFQSWLTDLEIYLRSDELQHSAIESHISKYRSLMPSLALIFHLIKRVSNETENASIELTTAELAAAWCSYLQKHAEKLYQIADLSEFDIAREILKKMEGGELGSKFTARDIYSKHWKRLSDPKEVNKGLEILVEYRQLHAIVHATAGRSKTVFINDRVE